MQFRLWRHRGVVEIDVPTPRREALARLAASVDLVFPRLAALASLRHDLVTDGVEFAAEAADWIVVTHAGGVGRYGCTHSAPWTSATAVQRILRADGDESFG